MNILVVDDDRGSRESIARFLQTEGFEASVCENGFSAQRLLQETYFDLVVLDLRMPGMDGLELLEWLEREGPPVPVIMVSAYGDIGDAVEAMKLGADDYMVKPVDPEELVLRIRRAIDSRHAAQRIEIGRAGDGAEPSQLGDSPQMKEIDTVITRIAATPSNVLVTGESGTGKEVVARLIHKRSGRIDEPFVPVNMAGIPESLLESELFGYDRGAFTGADSRKIGMFELAASGTLFMDEIGEMPLPLQVKILRAIQERSIRRLGGTRQIPIGARIIAATNRDLESDVRDGRFREDLYYRLNVVSIRIPPLRERTEDLPVIAGSIIRRLNKHLNRSIETISSAGLKRLSSYAFPGNIRELENILERAMIFSDGTEISERDLLIPESTETAPPKPKSLKAVEMEAISIALKRWDGNRTKAAPELGISRRTLINKIHEYGLGD